MLSVVWNSSLFQFKEMIRFFLFPFLLFIGSFCLAEQTSYDREIKARFIVESAPSCKKVRVVEPRMKNTPFYSERYYLSIDGEKYCQILDVWIQRVTEAITDNRRALNSIIYRFNGNAWVEEFGLDDKPLLRIKDKKTGIVYFFTEFSEDVFFRTQITYFSGAWEDKDRSRSGMGVVPLDRCKNMPVFECNFIRAALKRIIWLELGKEMP